MSVHHLENILSMADGWLPFKPKGEPVNGSNSWTQFKRSYGQNFGKDANRASCRHLILSRELPVDTKTLAVIVTIAFSLVGVLGDYFLKLASKEENSLKTPWFYLGFALYSATAFGWVFVMKHLKLATISVLYSVSMIVFLTAVGVVVFRETLSYAEIAGLVLAIAALILLVRFA